MEIIVQTEYFIGLSENNITDTVRNNYLLFLNNNKDEYLISFYTILKILIKNISNKTLNINEALTLIETEFNHLNMELYLNNFLNYKDLITLLFQNAQNTKQFPNIKLDIIKNLTNIAKNLPEITIKKGIYYATLKTLTMSNLFIEDLEYTKNLVQIVKDNGEIDVISNYYSNLIYGFLNNINF